MQKMLRFSFMRFLPVMGAVLICLFGPMPALPGTLPAPIVPTVSGDAGSCSADFAVVNGQDKPIYAVKINLTFHYGFLNLHKESLEVYTNSDGKARFEGLPNVAKNAFEFHLQSGDRQKTVTDDPGETCHASESVVLP